MTGLIPTFPPGYRLLRLNSNLSVSVLCVSTTAVAPTARTWDSTATCCFMRYECSIGYRLHSWLAAALSCTVAAPDYILPRHWHQKEKAMFNHSWVVRGEHAKRNTLALRRADGKGANGYIKDPNQVA